MESWSCKCSIIDIEKQDPFWHLYDLGIRWSKPMSCSIHLMRPFTKPPFGSCPIKFDPWVQWCGLSLLQPNSKQSGYISPSNFQMTDNGIKKKQQRNLSRSKYQSLLPLLSPLQALDSCLLDQPCCKQVGWSQHCRTDPRHWGTEAHHSDSDMAHCPKWKTRAMGPCPKTSKTNLHQNKLLALCHTKIWIGWIDADMYVQNHADALSRIVSTVTMHTSDFKISLTWWQKTKVVHFLR